MLVYKYCSYPSVDGKVKKMPGSVLHEWKKIEKLNSILFLPCLKYW